MTLYQGLNGKYRSMEFAVLKSNEKEKKSNRHQTPEPEDCCINVNKEELNPKFKSGSFELDLDYPDNPNFRIPLSATEEVDYPDDPNFRLPSYLPKATEDVDYPDDPNFRIPSDLPKATEDTDSQDDPNLRPATLPKATEDVDNHDNSNVLATEPKATEEAIIPAVALGGRI